MEIWSDEFKGSVTVCDRNGVITYFNQHAINQFGKNLLGTNLIDCHPEPARSKLVSMMKTPTFNTYTTQKDGIKRIIYQSPHFIDGIFSGIIELSFEIPQEMKHFNRD
jgi:hypothetical protein